MISFQTLALLINIAIVLAVGIWALRRRDTPGRDADARDVRLRSDLVSLLPVV